jgi:hypothetical protein
MTRVLKGVDFAIDMAAAVACGLGGYALSARVVSDDAAVLFGLGVFLSVMAWALGTHLQEARLGRLATGICPRCGARVTSEHRHRRWDSGRDEWLPPVSTWQCSGCGFSHDEAFACRDCPPA